MLLNQLISVNAAICEMGNQRNLLLTKRKMTWIFFSLFCSLQITRRPAITLQVLSSIEKACSAFQTVAAATAPERPAVAVAAHPA